MTKKYKNQKPLVEDSFRLELGHFPKRFQHLCDNKNGKSSHTGELTLATWHGRLHISYEIVPSRIDPYIKLCFKKNGKVRWQNIYYDFSQINYGVRPYLLCPCGQHRGNKLYLPPGGDMFKCRECWDLTYRAQTINRRVYGAELIYRFDRLKKLAETRERVKRVEYGGKLTLRAKSVVKMAGKWAPSIKELERMITIVNDRRCG